MKKLLLTTLMISSLAFPSYAYETKDYLPIKTETKIITEKPKIDYVIEPKTNISNKEADLKIEIYKEYKSDKFKVFTRKSCLAEYEYEKFVLEKEEVKENLEDISQRNTFLDKMWEEDKCVLKWPRPEYIPSYDTMVFHCIKEIKNVTNDCIEDKTLSKEKIGEEVMKREYIKNLKLDVYVPGYDLKFIPIKAALIIKPIIIPDPNPKKYESILRTFGYKEFNKLQEKDLSTLRELAKNTHGRFEIYQPYEPNTTGPLGAALYRLIPKKDEWYKIQESKLEELLEKYIKRKPAIELIKKESKTKTETLDVRVKIPDLKVYGIIQYNELGEKIANFSEKMKWVIIAKDKEEAKEILNSNNLATSSRCKGIFNPTIWPVTGSDLIIFPCSKIELLNNYLDITQQVDFKYIDLRESIEDFLNKGITFSGKECSTIARENFKGKALQYALNLCKRW